MKLHYKCNVQKCPYCPKRFIASVYLYAHIQRRHQGLPVNPMFNTRAHSSLDKGIEDLIYRQNDVIEGSVKRNEAKYDRKNMGTQTIIEVSNNDSTGQVDSDYEEVNPVSSALANGNAIVRKYLQEKCTAGEALEGLLPKKLETTTGIVALTSRRNSLEESERNIIKMKEELESQWNSLSQKLQLSGIQDIKSDLMAELQKMREMISATSSATVLRTAEDTLEKQFAWTTMIERSEERYLKQQKETQALRINLEKKEMELEAIQGRLDSQERYWRSKLQEEQEFNRKREAKLREEIEASLEQAKQDTKFREEFVEGSREQAESAKIPINAEESQAGGGKSVSSLVIPTDKSAVAIEFGDIPSGSGTEINSEPETPAILVTQKPTSPAHIGIYQIEKPIAFELKKVTAAPPMMVAPVPKARLTRAAIPVSHPPKAKAPTVKLDIIPPDCPPIPAGVVHHEYEEPDNIRNSDEVTGYSSSVVSVSTPTEERIIKRRKQKLTPKTEALEQVDRKSVQMDSIRAKVIEDIGSQMKELNLNPDGSQLEDSDAANALFALHKQRRKLEKVDQKFVEKRTAVKENLKFSATANAFKHSLANPRTVKPKRPSSLSPLVKMFSAVKSHGSNWRKKVTSSLSKQKTIKRQNPPSPKTPRLKMFFQRASARWKKNAKKKPEVEEEDESETETESSEEEESSSDEPTMPMITRSKPILLNKKRSGQRRRQIAKTPPRVLSASESSDSALKPSPRKVNAGRFVKNAFPQQPTKQSVRRDLIKEFEAVKPSTSGKQKGISRTSTPRKDISGDQSQSGTTASVTSGSESESSRSNIVSGHYVSLRPPSAPIPGKTAHTSTPNSFLPKKKEIPANSTGNQSPRNPNITSTPRNEASGLPNDGDFTSSSSEEGSNKVELETIKHPSQTYSQPNPSTHGDLYQIPELKTRPATAGTTKPSVVISTPGSPMRKTGTSTQRPRTSMYNSWDSDFDE